MTINSHIQDLHTLAINYGKEFGFSGKHEGSVDLVGGSPKAVMAANNILASLGHVGSVVKEGALGAGFVAVASFVALGELNPLAIGVATMAGGITSISKPRSRG